MKTLRDVHPMTAALCLLVPFANARAQCVPEWSAPSPPQHGEALALEVHDDGFGPALFVGGHLISAGGHPVNKIARWDGRRWSALGEGLNPSTSVVGALTAVPERVIPNVDGLLAGGPFQEAGGIPAPGIASWHRWAWSGVGTGLGPVGGSEARAMRVFGGPGLTPGPPLLYVGGAFQTAGQVEAAGLAVWDGVRWGTVEPQLSHTSGRRTIVNALEIFDDGSGPTLYVGGGFLHAGGLSVSNLARWDGEKWSAVGGGAPGGVNSIGVYNDGSGESLYVGVQTFPGLRRWDGQQWHTVPGWDSGLASDMLIHDDGTGPKLYIAGQMYVNNGVLAHVVSWDGVQWRPLPELSGLGSGTTALTLASFQDDSRGPPALYVGGYFWYAGGIEAIGLARWGCPHPTLGCYADCDLNGSLDFFDFLCFQNAFLAQDPYADCDRDGTLDFFDFLCFQNEFLAGCP